MENSKIFELEKFLKTRSLRPLIYSISVVLISFGVTAASASGMFLTSLTPILFTFAVSSLVLFPILSEMEDSDREKEAAISYKDLPLDLLIKAKDSPELSDKAKRVVTAILNENHAGWSLK